MALSNAERQRRYRERRQTGKPIIAYRRPKDRPQSRKVRLQNAVETIITIREDYRRWRDAVPEWLEHTTTVERLDLALEALEALDLDSLLDLELPIGYGRDR